MESKRQQKISSLLKRDLGEIFQYEGREHFGGSLITVTKVNVTKDLSIARVYLSLFPAKNKNNMMLEIKERTKEIRWYLGNRVKNQLRIIPELEFYLDDSLDYIERIEDLLDKDKPKDNDQNEDND
ncbi:MAG: 30S ribosome-binding factor RbfA [Bacteroidales bacterium]|nr:30S ribosome-binding factor RbfA [Bacteroidales bacterium]